MKRRFNKGDIVLCKKFSVGLNLVIDDAGMHSSPYIDDRFFNRRAYIEYTYKECMERMLGVVNEDKDEYSIVFLDDGNSLSWVSGDDLILLMRA